MAKLTKPDISVRWASLGDNSKPLDSYIQNGWEAVKPPRQFFNWLDNRQDSLLAYLNQAGIPEWDAVTEYEGSFSYVQGSDNKVYKCLADNTNTDPTFQPANAAFWVLAFAEKSNFDAVETRVATLETEMGDGSGVTNAAAWRTAIQVSSILPSGMVVPFAMSAVPSGWLECDGTAVSRTTYASLFAAIGVTYGVGDGSTTFNLPDLRGEFLRGWDHGRGVDSGRGIATKQEDALQGHRHGPAPSSTGYWTTNSGSGLSGGGTSGESGSTGDPVTDTVNGTPRTASETRPRNIAMMFCIKT